MIQMLSALQRVAEKRGDGLLPELADLLRKTPRLTDGHLAVIDGDAGDGREKKNDDKSKDPPK